MNLQEQWIESDAIELRADGQWYPASEVPYQACLKERLAHWLLEKHYFYGHATCLLCGCDRDEIAKPDYLTEPSWYLQKTSGGWRVYFGKVYGKYVFNFDTPWFACGYAW